MYSTIKYRHYEKKTLTNLKNNDPLSFPLQVVYMTTRISDQHPKTPPEPEKIEKLKTR